MADGNGCEVFTDAAWAVREPLIEEGRRPGKTPPKELRRTIPALFWRHRNGAKWRGIPAELGPWRLAAVGRWPSPWRRNRRMGCRWHQVYSAACRTCPAGWSATVVLPP